MKGFSVLIMVIAITAGLFCWAQAQAPPKESFDGCPQGLIVARKDVVIGSKLSRQIAKVEVKEGMKVKKGDVLMELDNEMEKLQVAVAKLRMENDAPVRHREIAMENALLDLKRAKDLLNKKVLSQGEYDKVKAKAQMAKFDFENQKTSLLEQEVAYRLAIARLNQTIVKAPIDGEVVKLFKEIGEFVDEHEEIVHLINIDEVYVVVYLKQDQLKNVDVGTQATLCCEDNPTEPVTGAKVIYVAKVVDPASKTRLVKLLVPNSDHKLNPGLTAKVRFK